MIFRWRVLSLAIMLSFVAGCGASLKLRTDLIESPWDVPMLGRTAERNYSDTSSLSLPLTLDWEYDVSAGFGGGSPVIIGSVLLMGTLQGEVHAVDVNTGERIGYIKNFSPISSSPAVYRRMIIFGIESTDENLIGLNSETGEVEWTRDAGGIVASPLIADNKLFAGGLGGMFFCIEPETGSKQWSFDARSPIRSSPCASEGMVFVAASNGTVYALDQSDGTMRWSYNTGNAVFAGLTVSGGHLFVGSRDSALHVLRAADGSNIRTVRFADKIVAAPAVADGRVIVPTLDGNVTALSESDGTVLWTYRSTNAVNTTPFIAAGKVVIASLDRKITIVSAADGSVLWQYNLDSRVKTPPLIWKNSLIIAAENKNIYRFR